eukprot:2100401-Alexandrium_andersonii.AAC.1
MNWILKGWQQAQCVRWPLKPDGDVWQKIVEATRARGVQSVRVCKVKGHATSLHIESGQVRPQDKRGNDQADRFAGMGVSARGEWKRVWAFVDRQQAKLRVFAQA